MYSTLPSSHISPASTTPSPHTPGPVVAPVVGAVTPMVVPVDSPESVALADVSPVLVPVLAPPVGSPPVLPVDGVFVVAVVELADSLVPLSPHAERPRHPISSSPASIARLEELSARIARVQQFCDRLSMAGIPTS